MAENEIISERVGSVEVITLNRPDSFNAFTPPMVSALDQQLVNAAADRSCRAVVLTGAGERAFCAGVDVKAVAARDAAANESEAEQARQDPVVAGFEHLHLLLGGVVRTIHKLPIPVIGAVNGHAIGGGFAFAAACDLRIASTNARFADGFVTRGISGCEMGLSYFLPRLVGAATAFDWMLTGRRVEPVEALEHGLVGQVVEPGELLATALDLGEAIAANAPMAITMTKEVMWANLHAVSLDQALALESRTQVMTRATADAAEARQSFLERRRPVFAIDTKPRVVR